LATESKLHGNVRLNLLKSRAAKGVVQHRKGEIMKNGRIDHHAADRPPLNTIARDAAGASERSDAGRRSMSLDRLWELSPFITRYKLMLILAGVGLIAAAGATLILPVAVRRVIDFGFSSENAGLINSYFSMLMLVAGALAAASALRF
jgi:ATP-binding cassette subfamily B protein